MAFQLTLVLLSVVVLSIANVNLGVRVARQLAGGLQPAKTDDSNYKIALDDALKSLQSSNSLKATCQASEDPVKAQQKVVNGIEFYFTFNIPAECTQSNVSTCQIIVYIAPEKQPVVQNSC